MGKSAARHSGKNATITCLAPDVCLTPMGSSVVPIPYMITSKLDWSKKTVPNVKLTKLEAFNMNSRTNKVVGDEAGSKGGVVSGVNKGWCRPKSNKSTVYVDGVQIIQHDSIYEMNCNGPDGPSNTVGKLGYIET